MLEPARCGELLRPGSRFCCKLVVPHQWSHSNQRALSIVRCEKPLIEIGALGSASHQQRTAEQQCGGQDRAGCKLQGCASFKRIRRALRVGEPLADMVTE